MSAAHDALVEGLEDLRQQFGEPFLVDGLGSFTGLCEETRIRNTLGLEGPLPGADAVLYIQRSEFEPIGLVPWIGMRVTVKGRDFTVTEISENAQRWQLNLEVAVPKLVPDVTCFTDALATHDGQTILFSAGLLQPD